MLSIRRVQLLAPLAHREFALLATGSTVSLLGDGFFAVALPFQVYRIDDNPAALSLVGVAWTGPLILSLLVGGIVSDRVDRRRVMLAADLLRMLVSGLIGMLSLTGALALWHLLLLMPLFGIGAAFFTPASVALLPDVVPAAQLPQANAFRAAVTPLATLLVGPAVGGLVVGALGPGPAILCDAASFAVSAAALALLAARPVLRAAPPEGGGVLADLRSALRYVRGQPWCWATLAAAALSLLAWQGPFRVLLPYLLEHELSAGAAGLGAIYAAGGVGAILVSLLAAQVGLPRRPVTVMFVAWAVGIAATASYGAMTALWQGLLAGFIANALLTGGQIIWETLLQRRVPRDLLGRVSSLDWLVSMGLVPVSFALVGPAAAWFGVRATLVGGGLLGGVLMGAFLLVPGVRAPDRSKGVTGGIDRPGRGSAEP